MIRALSELLGKNKDTQKVEIKTSKSVADKFDQYPDKVREKLMTLRRMIS